MPQKLFRKEVMVTGFDIYDRNGAVEPCGNGKVFLKDRRQNDREWAGPAGTWKFHSLIRR